MLVSQLKMVWILRWFSQLPGPSQSRPCHNSLLTTPSVSAHQGSLPSSRDAKLIPNWGSRVGIPSAHRYFQDRSFVFQESGPCVPFTERHPWIVSLGVIPGPHHLESLFLKLLLSAFFQQNISFCLPEHHGNLGPWNSARHKADAQNTSWMSAHYMWRIMLGALQHCFRLFPLWPSISHL